MNSEPTPELSKTPLFDWHLSHDGRMVDFAGWSMPVQYGSIMDEHHHTRNACGLFDVSHMGRIYFSGPNVEPFLEGLTTRRISGLQPGKIRYSFMTDDSGGILDDILVYRLNDIGDQPQYMMVVNASNRVKIVNWMASQAEKREIDIPFHDRTFQTAMIAVQGPEANKIVSQLSASDPAQLGYFGGTQTQVNDRPAFMTRTGYTGEDGCELIVEADDATALWSHLHELASELGGGASGLAARDTLRLEAALPLYGHELSSEINPAQTGMAFATNIKDRTFPGRDSIAAARKNSQLAVLVGLELDGRRPARENCDVVSGESKIGTVTSGTFSPTLQKSISLAYVEPSHSEPGTQVGVDIRGKSHPATVVRLPFYKRSE